MRQLNEHEISNVSGGSLTSLILDFFKNMNGSSQEETTEWVRPEAVPPAKTISGETFGMGIFGVVAAFALGFLAF